MSIYDVITNEELKELLNEIVTREYECFLHSNKDAENTQYLAATLSTVLEIANKFGVKVHVNKEVI